MGKVETRHQELLNLLEKVKTMKLVEIQETFRISPATARRMCAELEKQGKVLRCFGGIQSLSQAPLQTGDVEYRRHVVEHQAEKKTVGWAGCRFVASGDIIFLSGGTTTFQLALALAEALHEGRLHDVTIMTNSCEHAEALGREARVIVTGGTYRPIQRDLSGMGCEKALHKAHFDKAFIGVDGIDVQGGLMTFDIDTARIDQIVLNNATHAYILTDHSKFERKSFISYSTISEECTIVTDAGLSNQTVQRLRGAGVDLVQAEEIAKLP